MLQIIMTNIIVSFHGMLNFLLQTLRWRNILVIVFFGLFLELSLIAHEQQDILHGSQDQTQEDINKNLDDESSKVADSDLHNTHQYLTFKDEFKTLSFSIVFIFLKPLFFYSERSQAP
jgi:hypothetical protein